MTKITKAVAPLQTGESKPAAAFSPFRLNRVSATDILVETVTDNPELFNGRWFTVLELRDEIIHDYDLLRLNQTYGDNQGVSQALIHAVQTAGWLEKSGTGLDIKFRVRTMPITKPETLAECYELLDQYRQTLMSWKDMGLALHDSLVTLRSMKLTVEDAQDKLNQTLSLSVIYRNQAKLYHDILVENKLAKGTLKDPKPSEIRKFMEDPKNVMQVTDLKALHGFLFSEEHE